MFDELFKVLPPWAQFIILGVVIASATIYAAMRGLRDGQRPEVQAQVQSNPVGQNIPWWLIAGPLPDVFGAIYQIREVAKRDNEIITHIEGHSRDMLELMKRNHELFIKMEHHLNNMTVEATRMRQIFELVRDESRLR